MEFGMKKIPRRSKFIVYQLLVTSFFMVFLGQCNYSRTKRSPQKETLSGPGAGKSTEFTFQQIQQELLVPKCAQCHGKGLSLGGVNVENYSALVASTGSTSRNPVVIPGKPEQSPLFTSIKTGKMPPGGKNLASEPWVRVLEAWILQGASLDQPFSIASEDGVSSQPTTPSKKDGESSSDKPDAKDELPKGDVHVSSPSVPVDPQTPPEKRNENSQAPEGMDRREDKPQEQPVPAIAFDAVKTRIIDQHCIFCHEGVDASGGVMLDTKEAVLQGKNIRGIPLVVAGKAKESLLWQSIVTENSSQRMPPGDEMLPMELRNLLKEWIDLGAL